MMLVTILSVSFNSEKTIARTIESVFNQTYENIEYIIVDGASKDNTVAVAKSYQEKFDNTPGRKLTIISEPDNGMYDALNKGVRMANGELVGSINTDDFYELDAVETMAKLYEKEHYDAAWGDLRIIKPTGEMIKKAHTSKIWTTTGWCHPSMFATKAILTEFNYACIDMYDDFDFITRVHLAGKRNRQGKNPDGVYGNKDNLNDRKIVTLNKVISNFNFGGMSTKKDWADTRRRIKIKYDGYERHGMSPLYWFYCVGMEVAKFIFA